MMKYFNLFTITILVTILLSCSSSKNSQHSNMVARMQVDEPIPGVCDNNNVIAILPFPGNDQIEAIASKTDKEIEILLNSKVDFLRTHPDYNDEGTVGLIVNCKGEMVRCHISNKTKSEELDSQIVAVFAQLKNWNSGKVNRKSVDTIKIFGFTINGGKVSIN